MTKQRFIDTDILVDYSREIPEAIDFVESLTEPFLLSTITVAELYAGVREGRERTLLDTMIHSIVVIPVSEKMAVEGGLLRRQYFPSHGTDLPDAIIAAMVHAENAELATLNEKHFPMLKDVIVPYRKP